MVSAVGTKKNVRCLEFRGGHFSEVANVLHKWDFQSVTGTLSALGSVSASRSVRSGRFTVSIITTFLSPQLYEYQLYGSCLPWH